MRPIKNVCTTILVTIVIGVSLTSYGTAGILKEDNKTYLVDRTGERWDITEAVSIGFKPGGFEFGIGRNAIKPLDESDLETDTRYADAGARVIGVENGVDAHAYVVRKLTRHEIANTKLGDTAIAAAY